MAPMTTLDKGPEPETQAQNHRRKALEYLAAAQEAQRIVDRAYSDHPYPQTLPAEVHRLVGGLNHSVRLGLKAAQVHATLATMPPETPDWSGWTHGDGIPVAPFGAEL